MSFDTVRQQIIDFDLDGFIETCEPFYVGNLNYNCEIHIGPIDEWGEYEEAAIADRVLELGDVAHYLLHLAHYYGVRRERLKTTTYLHREYLCRIAGIYKKAARIGGGDAYDVRKEEEMEECILGGLTLVTERCVNHCISFDTLMKKNIEKLEGRYK